MKLHGRIRHRLADAVILARVAQDASGLTLESIGESGPNPLRLSFGDQPPECAGEVVVAEYFRYLAQGDILRINPATSEIRVLYRRESRHNTLFFTERCNSRCLMCSQPPRDVDDDYLTSELLKIIPSMDRRTAELGITGGEPTLLRAQLIQVLISTKLHLPATAVHVLTNGRLLASLPYAMEIASVHHQDVMFGIPLYSDIDSRHDFVVQAKGAFEQTMFGLLNLARVGIPIEIRMVIHRETFAGLSRFARYVVRNLPFATQVVMMGLEPIGFARSNLRSLWIDPVDYQDQLEEAVSILDDAGLRVFIYNHQLCVLRPSLHPFVRKSISDWKNIYVAECDSCGRKADCGGFFASAVAQHSRGIRPFAQE